MDADLGTISPAVSFSEGWLPKDICHELVDQFDHPEEGSQRPLGGIIMPNGEYVLNLQYKYRFDWFMEASSLKKHIRELAQKRLCKEAEAMFGCPKQVASDVLLVVKYPYGGTYGPHIDAPPSRSNVCRFTVAVRLPGEYEGGRLIFPRDNIDIPKIAVGDAVICDATKKHAITHVTRGNRYMFLILLHDA